ncbi:hypothetical protein EDI_100410 [Entamoeba dispar SAW760]|uniref:Uncharacterized protein n=1 Tax=Entamoeba dispar (strain ATCC PRA-260 / SAW760) TaxID=370354 RepID=B0EKX4_ENTDS|nr:uncharacterized protein EDI_100410 [Entamoeba dispar SAW760]EDR24831.1 hypothetical protein EDI_100410 [Entamoeba dispar SAW760]|eukprot:EDR24831.1 hypothetical protein EDI_100410 [Entamoeba dispar SAW760]
MKKIIPVEETKVVTYSMKELKRSSKTFEAIQQALILSILNVNGYGFKIKKPERRSQKTLQLMLVEELYEKGSTILLEENINATCNEIVKKELEENGCIELEPSDIDGSSSIAQLASKYDSEKLKQIKRHKNANKIALTFKELLQMSEKLGYKFKYRTTKPAKMTKKLEKISSVYGKVNLTLSNINEIGKRVNESIYERFNKESVSIIIPSHDFIIEKIWDKVIENNKKFDHQIEISTSQIKEITNTDKNDKIKEKIYITTSLEKQNTQNNSFSSIQDKNSLNLKHSHLDNNPQTIQNTLITVKPKIMENIDTELTSDTLNHISKEDKFISPEPSLTTPSNLTDFSTSFYPEESVISGIQSDNSYYTYENTFDNNNFQQFSIQPKLFLYNQQQNSYSHDEISIYPTIASNPINKSSNEIITQHFNEPSFYFSTNQNKTNDISYLDCFFTQSVPSNTCYD